MSEYLIKRDGRREKINPDKIYDAIMASAQSVYQYEKPESENFKHCRNLSIRISKRIMKLLNERIGIATVEEVQDMLVKSLVNSREDKVAESFILYRAERSSIRDSKSSLMNKIEEITYVDSKKSNIKRDNANVDGNTAMGTMLQYGSAVSKTFVDSFMIRSDIKKKLDEGAIYIHDKDFFAMGTTTCCQIELDKLFEKGFSTGHGFLRKPKSIASYASLAAIAIQSNQNDQHGGQSIPAFDYYMAPGITESFKKNLKENLSLLFDFLRRDIDLNVLFSDLDKEKSIFLIKNKHLLFDSLMKQLSKKATFDNHTLHSVVKKSLNKALELTNKQTLQAMEGLVHNLNTMHSRAGAQVPFSSLNFGTDTSEEGRMVTKNLLLAQESGLGNGETAIFPILIFKVKEGVNYNFEDPNYDLFKLSMRVSAKRLFPNYVFLDAPFNLQYYKEGDFRSEVATMGCRTRVIGNINGEQTSCGRGNLSFNTINLPRLGIKYGCNFRQKKLEEHSGILTSYDSPGFYKELDTLIDLSCDALLDRYEFQKRKRIKNFPFLMGQKAWGSSSYESMDEEIGDEILRSGTLSVGFIGLAECLIALIGEHHGESIIAQELGLDIIAYMRERMDNYMTRTNLNFSLLATPAEGLSGYFTKIDKKEFGVIAGITDKNYYTNSFHIPVSYKISIRDKIKKEAPYHELTNAGHITYVEVSGDLSNNLDAFESIIRCMKNSGIGYGSINHPIDRDPICGYGGVIEGDICPACNRVQTESKPFERIRRITGYLVGTLDRFNDGKKSEEHDRVKHTFTK